MPDSRSTEQTSRQSIDSRDSSVARLSHATLSGHHPSDDSYLEIGASTNTGNRYGPVNQDYCVVQEMYSKGEIPSGGKQLYIAAICDGHGILGDRMAKDAGKAMIRYLYNGPLRNKKLIKLPDPELKAEMSTAFRRGHMAACSHYQSPPKSIQFPRCHKGHLMSTFQLTEIPNGRNGDKMNVYRCQDKGAQTGDKFLESGSTATVAVVQGRRLCLGCVGDSSAVLGSCPPSSDQDHYNGDVTAQLLTRRHWGCDEGEKERIVSGFSSTTRVLDDGYVKSIEGPLAGYELSVTRALGHVGMEVHGVTAEPYIITRVLDENDCCLILASDGVWDRVTPEEAVNFVMDCASEGQSASQASDSLVQHAVDLGLMSPGGEQDNTSAAVIFLWAKEEEVSNRRASLDRQPSLPVGASCPLPLISNLSRMSLQGNIYLGGACLNPGSPSPMPSPQIQRKGSSSLRGVQATGDSPMYDKLPPVRSSKSTVLDRKSTPMLSPTRTPSNMQLPLSIKP